MKEFVKQSSVKVGTIITAHRRLDTRLDIWVVQAAIIQAAACQSARRLRIPRHLEYLTKNLARMKHILDYLKDIKQFI